MAAGARVGRVIALAHSEGHGTPMRVEESLELVAGVGVEGDRYAGTRRSVTLVATGELAAAAADLGAEGFDPIATRRNIVVEIDELPRKHGTAFTIGDTELTVWRDCPPCEVMDRAYGEGAKAAMRQRAGISAAVVTGGTIRVGDPVVIAD